LTTKHSIGFGRIRIDDEEDERCDGASTSFVEEANVSHDGEEILERAVANINDRRDVSLRNQPVEQCHLAADITDVGNCREFRQIVR